MEQHDLRKLMDACRGEGLDLSEPEMQPLREALAGDAALRRQFERSQAWDARLRAAVPDVSVPADLEQRLRAAAQTAAETQDAADDPPVARSPRVSRRVWWAVAAGAAAAGLVWAVSWLPPFSGSPVGEEELVAAVQSWTKHVLAQGTWQRMTEQAPPADRPIASAVRAVPRRWISLAALDDPRAVAYELVPPDGDGLGWLFVVRTRRDCQLTPVPYRQLATGGVASGLTIAAWQDAEHLYVLVIPSDGPPPHHFVPSTPAV